MAIKLSKISTEGPEDKSKEKILQKTEELVLKIGELQHKLYAEGKQSLLQIHKII